MADLRIYSAYGSRGFIRCASDAARRFDFSVALARPIPHRLRCLSWKSGLWRFGQDREIIMLTRRGFAGFASCAICGLTGFIATEASAQGAPSATTPGVTRKILSQMEGPVPGYVTINAEAELEPAVMVARHTHPGIESGYILEGGLDLLVEGQPTRTLKPGDGFQVPPETPHAGGKNGDKKTRIAITYVVEKGKPLASPA
jgi:quercetin dioxygenase-like cupin family protein